MNSLAVTENVEIPFENTSVITAKERQEFEFNGFLVYENVLDAIEIEKYKAIIAQKRSSIKHTLYGEKAGQPRGENDLLELRNAIVTDDSLLDLMVHPKAFPIIVDLMGPHISLITSHIFFRPPTLQAPNTFKQIDWHRDGPAKGAISFNGKYPWLYTKIGFFLTDLTIKDAGSLRVLPGSHLNDIQTKSIKNGNDPIGAYEVKVPAGSIVIFDNRIMHAVGPNYSNIARENIYFGYGWCYIKPIDFVSQSEELLAKCTPIQKQLLGVKTSDLGYYLPSEEDVPLEKWQQQRLERLLNHAKK